MLLIALDPSPMVQAGVYMAGVLLGYVLLVQPDEWQNAWESLRNSWSQRRKD
ncbi:MAG: hypothetical protein ACXWWN_07975 [Gemmatimonadales bacterium]|nr:hypothetical protein [Gemmatimonadales bacterium]